MRYVVVFMAVMMLAGCSSSRKLTVLWYEKEQPRMDSYFDNREAGMPFRPSFYTYSDSVFSAVTASGDRQLVTEYFDEIAAVRPGDSTGIHSSFFYHTIRQQLDLKLTSAKANYQK